MDCSTPGCPVLHYLPEFTEIYVNWVSDAIQPSHPLLPTSPLALDLSQNRWGEKVIVRLYKIIYAKLLKIVKHYRIFFFNSTQFKKRKKNEGTTYLEKPIFIDLGQSSIFTTSPGGQVPFKISWLIVLSSTSIRKVSVHFSSVTQSCPTLGDPINCSIPGLPVHHQLLESTKTMSIESVMPSDHLILCHPLLLLPPIPPSIRVFSNESALCIRWPKYWTFSFNISPSNEHPGLICFRMDWLDLPAVQGNLKSLLQHHSLTHAKFNANW